jgi:hypothetical protein
MSRSKQEVTQMLVVAHERARQKLAFDAVIKQARYNNYKRTHAKKKKRYQNGKSKKRASHQKDAFLDPTTMSALGALGGGAETASMLAGLLRSKEPGERRRDAVLRSLGTGAMTGTGIVGGGMAGSVLGDYLRKYIKPKGDVGEILSYAGPPALGALLGGLSAYKTFRRETPGEKGQRLGEESEELGAQQRQLRSLQQATKQSMEKDAIFEQLGSLAARAGRGVLGMPGIKRIPGAGDASSYFGKLLGTQTAKTEGAKRLAEQTAAAGKHQRASRSFVEQLRQRIFPGREALRTQEELVRRMGGGFPTRQAVTDVLADRGIGRRMADAITPGFVPGSLQNRIRQQEVALAMKRLGQDTVLPEATGAGLRNLGIGTALGLGGLGYAAT